MSPTTLNTVSISVYLLSAGMALLAIGQVVLRQDGETVGLHARSLAVFFAVFAIGLIDSAYYASAISVSHPRFIGAADVLLPLLPAALWIYVRSLTEVDAVWSRSDWRHAVPFGVNVLMMIPLLMLAPDHKAAFGETLPDPLTGTDVLVALGITLSGLLWFGLIIGYGRTIVRRLRTHRVRVRQLFSTLDVVGLPWVTALLWFIALIAVQTIMNDLLVDVLESTEVLTLADSFVKLAFAFFMGMFAVRQHPFMPHWASAALGDPDAQPGEDVDLAFDEPFATADATDEDADTATERSYARSALTDSDCDRIVTRLDAVMTEQQPWANATLTLRDLAQLSKIRPRYITQALNTRGGRNFYEYVNVWRVQAAQSLLSGTTKNVSRISVEAGFNSRSTFYSAFKRETGQTPTEYRNLHPTSPPHSTEVGQPRGQR